MKDNKFEEYLNNRYYKQIGWYDQKAVFNRKRYIVIQWILIIFAAITPVLVAIGGTWERWSAVVVSSIVAIGTSALKVFKYQENWLHYRTTCETLRKEIHYFDANTSEYRYANDKKSLFVERIESLISRENTLWLSTHKKEHEAKKQ